MSRTEGLCPFEANFYNCARKLQKATVNNSIEKPILLNFVNLPTMLCPRL